MPVDPAALGCPVETPATVEALRERLAAADAAGTTVRAAGGGCFLDLGGPAAPPALVLRTTGLDRVLFYEPGELVVKVEAGVTLAALQRVLEAKGQELPWDFPWPDRQTIGGLLASGLAGPRRLSCGMPRDHVLGVTVVLSDGTVLRPGGRVVKNVAGYDLTRLFTGSRGALGIIAEAALKVRPVPEDAWAAEVRFTALGELLATLQAVWDSPVAPAFLLASGEEGSYALCAGLEGLAEQVAAQRAGLAAVAGFGAPKAEWTGREAIRALLAERTREPWVTPGPVIRASVPRRRIGTVLERASGRIMADAGSGVVRVAPGLELEPEGARALLGRLHGAAAAAGGWAVQERGPLADDEAAPSLAPRAGRLDAELRSLFDPAGALSRRAGA